MVDIDFKGFFASKVRKWLKMAVLGMGFIRIKKMLTLRAVSLCSTLPTLRFGRTGGFIHTPLAPTKKAPINGTFFYWSEGWDLNPRPLRPERSALPG